jgi:plastocyanin
MPKVIKTSIGVLAAYTLLLSPLDALAADTAGRVEGRVFFPTSVAVKELPQIVVFLKSRGQEPPLKVPAEHAKISQKGAKFFPELLVIPKGQTVDFINDDKIDHNVFSFSSARRFDLGIYPQGLSKSVTFEKEGPIFILCSIHEWMTGVIYVSPTSLYAMTAKDGAFAIENVPPGSYMSYTWNAKLPTATEAIEISVLDVKSGKATPLMIDLSKDMGGAKGGETKK